MVSNPETHDATPIKVLLATPAPFRDGVLDYLAPHPLPRGTVITAPLRGKGAIPGVVLGEATGEVAAGRLRAIASIADTPPIPTAQLEWIRRVAAWTLAPKGAVLKMMLPNVKFLGPLSPRTEKRFAAETATPPNPDSDTALTLNNEQQTAAASLREAVRAGGFAPFLLDGVTGSGKTEVYFEAVAEALRQGKQALILLPEIALTQSTEARIAARFGAKPLLWHSALTPANRHAIFRAVMSGDAPIVLGARSALFLPFARPGVIVVDEEHDSGYKQEDNVAYHARDMAVLRAAAEKIPVVLVSATPSLESEVNAGDGRYRRLTLTARATDAALPEISLIDTGKLPPERGRWIAPPLLAAMREVLERGEQVMLFLNRRGYAPVTVCRKCGEKVACPNCAAWLVTHKSSGKLQCHHCGHGLRFLTACPACNAVGEMVPCGPGVERLAEETAMRFPDARQAVLSSDTIPDAKALAAVMEDITAGKVDIIIGTQIVAKGHHFPHLTLVGVVDADLSLAGGDLRAAEHTWQLMTQVAGRAGRERKTRGRAMLQTCAPDTAVLQCLIAGDRAGFIACEKAARIAAGMPPFGRLAAITLSARNPDAARTAAAAIKSRAPDYKGVAVLGPAPAPIAVLRGRHRLRFLIRAPKEVDLQKILREWLGGIKPQSGVRMAVDVEPYSFV